MRVTWQVKNFDEADIVRSYIRYLVSGQLRRYDVRADSYTIREADDDEANYTAAQLAEAKNRQGWTFNMVRVA